MSWRNFFPEFIAQQWDSWFKKFEGALVKFAPPYIMKDQGLFSPIVAVVALLAVVFFAGLALGAFFTLFSSLLVLYFILTKIFGIRIDTGDVFSI